MADDDARVEAERLWPDYDEPGEFYALRDAFVRGWQASRTPVVADDAHSMDADGLCNYRCTGCGWRYAHVGRGNPDDVAWRRWGQEHRAAPVVADVDAIARLLRDLVDDDDCWFDHNGGCQAHGYISLKPGEICPQAEAKSILARLAGTDNTTSNGDSR